MLGKLQRITNIRTVWPDEARNFTPWLAEPDNLAELAEAIGLDRDGLEVEGIEQSIGTFSADIVCRSTSPDGGLVVIENMFGKSDHDHLGKLLTYASGTEAKTVILIAETIREEHRAALDWLNAISDDQHSFFACEIELWRIGDSSPAPRFNLIVKPNDWSRNVRKQSQDPGILSELKTLYQRYWQAFVEKLSAKQTRIRPRKPLPQHWLDFAIGKSGVSLSASASTTDQRVRVELYFSGEIGKTRFSALLQDKATIEADYGCPLDWDPLPDRLGARISLSLGGVRPDDETTWENQHDWLVQHFIRFDKVFRQRIAALA